MDFKTSLDRYLTQTPEEYYGIDEGWYEKVWDNIHTDDISDEEYDRLELTLNKWEDKLMRKGYSPKEAAILIVRTYKRFHNE